ncbi:MAG TPA: 50S ribosomal protein L4 [bacterium]|mgnify:CR=1 FL=1|nr:50S ribosomal protein L4 [bacterium]
MIKVNVYNAKGAVVKERELNDESFGMVPNVALIHQVVDAQQASARHPFAHTKTRGEVSGGGKKPWKQKGNGRARAGSTRSPLWVGGGTTFGPRNEENFIKKINKKMKVRALYMCLADKISHDGLVVLDQLELSTIKTKEINQLLKNLSVQKKVLLVLPKQDQKVVKSCDNLPNVKVILADSLNCVDVLNYNTVLLLEDAVEVIEKTYKL